MNNADRERCLHMIREHLTYREPFITSWSGFYRASEIGAAQGESTATLLKCLKYGVTQGWLRPGWVGVGYTPWSMSPRRQRVWDITDNGKAATLL